MSTEVLKSYVHNSPVETVTGPTESTVGTYSNMAVSDTVQLDFSVCTC